MAGFMTAFGLPPSVNAALWCSMRTEFSMDIKDLFKTITERIQTTASVESVYGDPITVHEKTVIPVARVRYGFGAGGGSGYPGGKTDEAPGQGDLEGQAEGGGGGGGVEVTPLGVVEITDEETRFVRIHSRRMMAAAFAAGFLLARLRYRKGRDG